MVSNEAGQMIEKWYFELAEKYPDKKCHEMIVMPNHFHCIIENMDVSQPGADAHDRPQGAHVGAPLRGRPDHHPDTPSPYGPENKKYHATVGDAMDWFKTMTTNEYIRGVKNEGWERFNGKLWHRNYWEHIIRTEMAYHDISNYIVNNPKNWNKDSFF
ncbi:transposase [Haliscomenobacter hydrossis]|nr:transposase [Haliscomenobacter hydrossis]